MDDEQTNKSDTPGAQDNKPVQEDKEPVDKSEEPMSVVDEAKKVRDEIKAENDRRDEILKKEQKLEANKVLGGTTGGHVEAPKVDKAQQLADEMVNAFK